MIRPRMATRSDQIRQVSIVCVWILVWCFGRIAAIRPPGNGHGTVWAFVKNLVSRSDFPCNHPREALKSMIRQH